MTGKQCTRCNTVKPLDEFYAHPHTTDGHQSQCKACLNDSSNINARRRRKARHGDSAGL